MSRNLDAEIEGLREDLSNYIEEAHARAEDHRRRSRERRVENIHILVALAVFSAYLSDLPANLSNTEFGGAFEIFGIVSIIYLGLKITIISVRPVWDPKPLAQFDGYFLPIIYVILLWGSVTTLFLDSIPIVARLLLNLVSIQLFITIEVIILIFLGVLYVRLYGRAMGLQTTSNDRIRVFSGGPHGDSLQVFLRNQTNQRIPKEDVHILIDAPDDIEIGDVQPAVKVNGGWMPAIDLEPNERFKISINVSPGEDRTEPNEETITVKTEYGGEVQTETLQIRI